MKTTKQVRAAVALEGDGAQYGEDGAPTAFRIWRAGVNVTDYGPHVLTDRSLELLLEQQATRGNLFSVDINHLSLNKDAPLENQKAVGFFRIEARGGELWAVGCEWTDTVRAGLAKRPPEWRFHSPAYAVDPDSGEIVSLTNLALTNNPATHHVTALASRGATQGQRMTFEEAMAALEGDDAEKKEAAKAAIRAAFCDDEKDDAEKKEASADSEDSEEKKASADSDEEKAPESKKEASVAASVVAKLDAELKRAQELNAKLAAKLEADERKAVMATREMSTELAKTLASMPLADVKRICAGLPAKKAADPTAAQKVSATRGAGEGGGGSMLPPEEKAKLDERMGLKKVQASIENRGVHQVIPAMSAEEARAFLASKKGGN